jgi:hypothetical protein
VPVDDDIAAEVEKIGKVEHLVSPNIFHHLSIGDWKSRYPDAVLWAPPGLGKKRGDLTIDRVLERGTPPEWGDAIVVEPIDGTEKIQEHAFFHAPSASVIVTDLAFHITHSDHWWTRFSLKLVRAFGKLTQSRMWRGFTTDRAAAAQSLERVIAWPGERLLVGHGENVEGETGPIISAACPWMLAGRAGAAAVGSTS